MVLSAHQLEPSLPPEPDGADPTHRLAAVGRLAGMVAHAVNNPLTVVQLRADLLAQEPLSPSARAGLDQLRVAVDRLAETIRLLQQVARPSGTTPRRSPLAPALDRALEAEGVEGRIFRGEGVPADLEAWADPEALVRALAAWVRWALPRGLDRLAVSRVGGRVRIELGGWGGGGEATAEPDPLAALQRSLAELLAGDLGGALSEPDGPGGPVARLELLAPPEPATVPRRVLLVSADPSLAAQVTAWCAEAGHACAVAADPGGIREPDAGEPPLDAILLDHPAPGTDLGRPRRGPEARVVRVRRAPDCADPGELGLTLPFTSNELAACLSAAWDR